MIFSKFYHFERTTNRSITIILRKYIHQKFQRKTKMPKNTAEYLTELQKQRKRIKAQAAKYSPSHIYLQVIGNGSRSESRSVLLVTDHTHYLFNCGEGTQRLATEHHAKLTKIQHILITSTTWNNMGGIPGVALTVQDTGVPKINLHGPEGSIDIVQATANFMTLDQLSIEPTSISEEYTDQTMTITYVPINNPNKQTEENLINAEIQLDSNNYYNYQINSNQKRSHSPNVSKKMFNSKTMSFNKKRIDSLMAYICKVHSKEGTLDFQKCVEQGVPPGPDLKKLKSGQDITLPDGKIVRSTDVVSKTEPGPLIIVMECPDENWMTKFIENPTFEKYYQQSTSTDKNNLVNYIIHFTPDNILNNPKYKEWMHKFGTETLHVIVNEGNTGFSSEAIHRMQHQLHLINPTIFPFLPYQDNLVDPELNENAQKYSKNQFNDFREIANSSGIDKSVELNKTDEPSTFMLNKDGLRIYHCQTLNTIHLRPHRGLKTDANVKIIPKQYIEEVFEIDGFLDALAELQTELNAKTKSLENTEEYPRLLMLGTGSSIPNKIRNTSGILLQLDEDRSIILDCGEGTVGQLVRFFDKFEIDRVLKSIKAIYVSHLHADHHLGLIGLLQQRRKVTDEPLFLLAPKQINLYLNFYHSRFEPILENFKLICNADLILDQQILSPVVSKDLYDTLQVSNISTVFVTHCPYAYAVSITLKDGRKICYSGDTVPCDNLIKLARDNFLLIHEATMEDDLENEALAKRHSTISQAINDGIKAGVNFTLLTHFSQRYSKIPLLPSEKSGVDFSRVGIAYDFMIINLSKLSLLPLMYPCLSLMFQEFRAMLDVRASKREQKKEQVVKNMDN